MPRRSPRRGSHQQRKRGIPKMSLARAFKIRDRVVIKRKGKAAEYIVTEDK